MRAWLLLVFAVGCGRSGLAESELPIVPRAISLLAVAVEDYQGPPELMDRISVLTEPRIVVSVMPLLGDEPRPAGVRVNDIELSPEGDTWHFTSERGVDLDGVLTIEVYDEASIAIRHEVFVPDSPAFERIDEATYRWDAERSGSELESLSIFGLAIDSPTEQLLLRMRDIEDHAGEIVLDHDFDALMFQQQIDFREPQVTVRLSRFAE